MFDRSVWPRHGRRRSGKVADRIRPDGLGGPHGLHGSDHIQHEVVERRGAGAGEKEGLGRDPLGGRLVNARPRRRRHGVDFLRGWRLRPVGGDRRLRLPHASALERVDEGHTRGEALSRVEAQGPCDGRAIGVGQRREVRRSGGTGAERGRACEQFLEHRGKAELVAGRAAQQLIGQLRRGVACLNLALKLSGRQPHQLRQAVVRDQQHVLRQHQVPRRQGQVGDIVLLRHLVEGFRRRAQPVEQPVAREARLAVRLELL